MTPKLFQTPPAQRRMARWGVGLVLLGIDLLAGAAYHLEGASLGLLCLLGMAPLHVLWLRHLRQLARRLQLADGQLRYEAPGRRVHIDLDELQAVFLEPELGVSTARGRVALPLATFEQETLAATALRALRPGLEDRGARWRRGGLPLILDRRPGYTGLHLAICLLFSLFGVGVGLAGMVTAYERALADNITEALGVLAVCLLFAAVLLALCSFALRSYVRRWVFGREEIVAQGLFGAERRPVASLLALVRSAEERSHRGHTWPCALLTLRFEAPHAPLVIEPTENGLGAGLEPRADAALLDDLAEALVALYGLPGVERAEKDDS